MRQAYEGRVAERESGGSRSVAQIILEASLEVRRPIVYATLIVVMAVMPVLFIEGLSGAFFKPLVMAYVLAHFVVYTKSTTVATGLQCGFWTWLGFVATSIGTNYLFERRPLRLFLVNSGYNLVSLLGMGAVLAVWQ